MIKNKFRILQKFDRLRVINHLITTSKKKDFTMYGFYRSVIGIFLQIYTLSPGAWNMEKNEDCVIKKIWDFFSVQWLQGPSAQIKKNTNQVAHRSPIFFSCPFFKNGWIFLYPHFAPILFLFFIPHLFFGFWNNGRFFLPPTFSPFLFCPRSSL